MSLTAAQKATLKAAIIADNTLNAFPNDADGGFAIAAILNQLSSPAVSFWASRVLVSAVLDSIDWTKFTPADALDGSALQQARMYIINIKQMNVQTMLIGRDTLDASKANVRAGLRDSTTGVPAGAGGVAVSPGGSGGATILAAMQRTGTKAEVIFSPGTAVTGPVTANLFGWEGLLSGQDVRDARDS